MTRVDMNALAEMALILMGMYFFLCICGVIR